MTPSDPPSTQAQLIAEQLAHFRDQLTSKLDSHANALAHQKEINDQQLAAIRSELADLKQCAADYETRIRQLTEAATQYRTLAALATGGGLLSVIALLKELLP